MIRTYLHDGPDYFAPPLTPASLRWMHATRWWHVSPFLPASSLWVKLFSIWNVLSDETVHASIAGWCGTPESRDAGAVADRMPIAFLAFAAALAGADARRSTSTLRSIFRRLSSSSS